MEQCLKYKVTYYKEDNTLFTICEVYNLYSELYELYRWIELDKRINEKYAHIIYRIK